MLTIKILTKISAKITIIVVENREHYYFIIIYKCKEVPLSLFSYQILASTFDSDEQFSYYKVYEVEPQTILATLLVLSHCDNLFFQILTMLYIGIQSQCSIKMLQSGKILHATMWRKIVTACSQNLLYVTSATKMWYPHSLIG